MIYLLHKKIFAKSFFLACALLITLSVMSQSVITVGTGTTTNASTGYPSPYGGWYSQSRSQTIILASELNAAGMTGAAVISSIAFDVTATNSAGIHQNFQIKMKNTTATSINTTTPAPYGYDNVGLTPVVNAYSYTPGLIGWNVHTFNSTFTWDGVSNLLIDICHDNGNSNYTYSLSVNASTTVSTMWLQAISDGISGTMCPTAQSATAYSTRPNMRFVCTMGGGGASIPPIAGYVYNVLTDTVWINSPNIFTNVSNNALNSYWDITGYSPTVNGTYTPYTTTRKCTPQWPGMCYIDTTNTNFKWTFPTRGYYKVKLKVINNYGADSIEKKVYVDTPNVKPVASFFSDRRTVGFTDQLNYYDLSLNGPTQWSWWLNPGYIGSSTFAGAGLPNSWSPGSTIQNPQLNALDGGNFDVCLMVSNLRGSDTLCKHNYLTVNNGYMMCNGSDSV
ncbi:MAG: hypothetical protein WCO54_04170, partial [Bacteroidota bacterium]